MVPLRSTAGVLPLGDDFALDEVVNAKDDVLFEQDPFFIFSRGDENERKTMAKALR